MGQTIGFDRPAELGPATAAVWNAVISAWPEHAKFLRASFASRSSEVLDTTEIIARLLIRVTEFDCAGPQALRRGLSLSL